MSDENKDRRQDDPRFKKLFFEVGQLRARHDETIQKLELNTQATLTVKKNTDDIVEAWKALSGGLKVLGWLGSIIKYFTLIGGAIAAASSAWYAITHWGGSVTPTDIPK